MGKKYLFITQSDLSMQDSNGRTLRDVFGYVDNKDIYSFCTNRKNPVLSAKQTFCIDQNRLFKKKRIHRDADSETLLKSKTIDGRNKKNPLTCILRNLAWNMSFVFWKSKFKKWIRQINPDVIVFNPGDFAFMHKIATFASKIANKKLVIYNTEDYYFKTWNYLHDERGFKKLYPAFRKQLVRAYNKSFNASKIIMHNTPGLMSAYSAVFKSTKHAVVYHPSNLIAKEADSSNMPITSEFYYCGALDKGRDKTLILFAKLLERVIPEALIVVNGPAPKECLKVFSKCQNIKYEGIIEYQEVSRNLLKKRLLLSINSLDEYQLKDKKHAFSTKLSDYVASFNIIFHISLANDEYNVIRDNNLGFVSSCETEIINNLQKLSNCLEKNVNPFKDNMVKFYKRYLNPISIYNFVRKEVE